MSAVELTEGFLAKIGGWEAMKQARSLLERGNVLSSHWTPPLLKGVVQEGSISYRAGLVLKSGIDLENICSCRASRQWGTICAHSMAVGLHHLKGGVGSEKAKGGLDPDGVGLGSELRPASLAGKSSGSGQPANGSGSSGKGGRRIARVNAEEGGQPAQLRVILPPNIPEAARRGKITVYFEIHWGGGRVPMTGLPPGFRGVFSEQDMRILDEIESAAGGQTPVMLSMTADSFCALARRLVGHEGVTIGRSQPVTVSAEIFRPEVHATLQSSGEIELRLGKLAGSVIPAREPWVLEGSILREFGLPASFQGLLAGGVMQLPRSRVPQFLIQEWGELSKRCQVRANFELKDFVLEPSQPRFLLSLSGGLAQLQGQLQCGYGVRIITVGVTDESFWLPDPEVPTRYSTRDLGAEQAALSRLRRSGFEGPDSLGKLQLLGQNSVLSFFAREYPRLEKEWTVTLEERLDRSARANIERVEPRFEVTPSGEQWFDLSVHYSTPSGERFSAAEIQRLILSGQGHTRLKNGRFAVIDTGAVEELQEVLVDCAPRQLEGRYRMANAQAGFLESALREHSDWEVAAPAVWRERAARQSGIVPLETPDLGDLSEVLRPYQKQGVAWLRFLRENMFGGILADEMGLGKTLQALAFIRSVILRELEGGAAEGRGPVLVVCPTSLVFSWVNEAARFTPGLKVLALEGPERHKQFERISEADVVVTSYALIRRDAALYRELRFDTVILDEAQHIKNRQTQNAQAVKAVRADHRIVLTGTPLENSVLDLWSIFDFLMPGYLGSAKDFRERYELPIARERNTEAQGRLAKRVRPFMLRRLKREVAKDLPEKIEQVTFCELTDAQRAVYQQVLELGRKEVVEAVQGEGAQKSRMIILNALLRLRQICCDLRLLQLENVEEATASGKLELFEELLQEVLDGGHRALIFSQFVSMLQILKKTLEKQGLEYCYLDGSTTNREEVVSRFQNDASIPIFLISLKAGGVGLNLAAADTVIHFDPWWNPAVEDQATDRVHRIGQTRVVTSYKLITRESVEEKILNLQQRKRAVTQSVLDGEESFASSLSWEEIQELFE